ncbi:hypothetical protein PoB_004990100 [Plakobranchus ocellatus]|uniref:Uncharacterized protein n=1 Tax=Plakobranchus ocellatus TaxID=259542 RepID=A0AAV4BJ69_9GAST|nr:hypothetical protein PoB_004990100 [Plakobranchus ocellatus]
MVQSCWRLWYEVKCVVSRLRYGSELLAPLSCWRLWYEVKCVVSRLRYGSELLAPLVWSKMCCIEASSWFRVAGASGMK